MSIEVFWTGFEGGESCGRTAGNPLRGAVMGDGTARTGEFYCKEYASINYPNMYHLIKPVTYPTLGIGMADGEECRINYRVFFRTNAVIGSATYANCGGIGYNGDVFFGNFIIDPTNHIAAYGGLTISSYTGFALAMNTWYRVDLKYRFIRGTINCAVSLDLYLYSENGTFIENVSISTSVLTAGRDMFNECAIGHSSTPASSYDFDYDDLFIEWRDRGDAVLDFAFPSATKISRAGVTGQGASAAWTGDYRTVTDVPRELTTDEQTTAVNGATTTFTHDSASDLLLGDISGVTVCAALKASVAGNDALMLAGSEYTVAVGVNYPSTSTVPPAEQAIVNYLPWTHAAFDAMEFGARNKRGISLQLGKCYLEVLHNGTGLPAPFAIAPGGYNHKIISWVGNGTYQEITDVKFGAQVIIIKPVSTANGSVTAGVFKLSKMGGTLAFSSWNSPVTNGILEVTSDGCKLGPNANVNAVGVTYIGMFFRDGGLSYGGQTLDCGNYVGGATDDRNIDMNYSFEPDVLFMGCGSAWRLDTMGAGDISFQMVTTTSTITNMIQSLSAGEFQVGTGVETNSENSADYKTLYTWIAFLKNGLNIVTGVTVPTGPTITITGLPFSPILVIAQRNPSSAQSPCFRTAEYFTGANSKRWDCGFNYTAGITSLTADGFTAGSDVVSGVLPVYWLALGPINQGGLYYVTPGATHDSYNSGVEVAIPSPTIRTALIGE